MEKVQKKIDKLAFTKKPLGTSKTLLSVSIERDTKEKNLTKEMIGYVEEND